MRKYLAEFLGTAFFIYIILATGNAVAIGAALALVIMLTSRISGGNINPAVSVAMASAGNLPLSDLLPYIIAQVLGGLVAVFLFRRIRM
jgi:aquaporin Z